MNEKPFHIGLFVEVLTLLAVELCFTELFLIGYRIAVLACHCFVCAGYWYFFARGPERGSWPIDRLRKLLALSIAALGPFGVVGVVLTLYRLWLRHAKNTPFDDWYNTLFPTIEITRPDFLHRLLVRSGSAITGNVSPFADIMRGLDDVSKLKVLSLVIDHFIPEYVPALKHGLTDPDPTIRVSAATVMASIEGRYLARGIALEDYIAKAPQNLEAKRALADHLDDYAHSGLLDRIRTDEMRERALSLYRSCADSSPVVINRIGRLLVHLGHLEEANHIYDSLLATTPKYLPAMPWKMETLYRLGCFSALREFAYTAGPLLTGSLTMPVTILDAIREWEGAPDEHKQAS